jgi:hypothetical protein
METGTTKGLSLKPTSSPCVACLRPWHCRASRSPHEQRDQGQDSYDRRQAERVASALGRVRDRAAHWSRAVSVLGLSLRPGNRQHDAVDVAAQSRAGWTIARVSASVVAVNRPLGAGRGGSVVRRSGFAGSARCSPSVSCRFLTAGCFPPAGGRWRPVCRAGRAVGRCGPVGEPSGPGQPARAAAASGGSTRSARQRRGRSQDRPQRNELWRGGLHGRL